MTAAKGGIVPQEDIGNVATPPFVRLPSLTSAFQRRAVRASQLAALQKPLEGFLLFVSSLAGAQHAALEKLPAGTLPGSPEIFDRRKRGASAVAPDRLWADPTWTAALDAILERMATTEKPEAAEAARRRLVAMNPGRRQEMARRLLDFDMAEEDRALTPYVAAGLQVHATRMASLIDPQDIGPEEVTSLCPVCGNPPVASLLHTMGNLLNTRFLSCGLCSSEWHCVRIKCSNCASTKGINYQVIEGQPDAVRAETCDECKTYLKIISLEKEPDAEAVIDDLATLGLDILVSEAGWQRIAPNPFLTFGDA